MRGLGLGPDAVSAVAAVLRRSAFPTPFAHSSDARHALRAELCRKGWGWHAAEMTAAETVNAALRRVGARWPRWEEGQPEYCQPGVLNAPRDACANCRRPLPEGHFRYCSKLCADAWRRKVEASDGAAWARARTSSDWREVARARIPERACRQCGERFRPRVMAEAGRVCGDCR